MAKGTIKDFSDVYDTLFEGVQILDNQLRYVYINPVAAKHGRTTPTDLVGKKMIEAYPGIEETPVYEKIQSCLEKKIEMSLDNEFTHNDGSIGWFQLFIRPHERGVLILSIDVTEQKSSEERHYHKNKLNALERLAAGVAHDFNNKLSIFELCFNTIEKEHTLHENIKKSLEANIQSSKELIQTLSCFASPKDRSLRGVDINSFLSKLNSQYDPFLGEEIKLKVLHENEKCIVDLTPVQIDQILLNLIVNAKQAMEGKGKITISSKIETITELKGMHPTLLKPGKYAHLKVMDNGSGIDPETITKIFEYYFTTKPEGIGTGLGLSTINTLIEKNGGKIQVQSQVGQGTEFDIWLKAH